MQRVKTMNPRAYSQRLGTLTPEQLQAALNCFELGTLTDAQPISAGMFGQNLFVSSDQGDWVLRGCPHTDWQFPAERFFTGLIRERSSLPVAHPYLYEPSSHIFGWPFVLTPRMPGLQLEADDTYAALGEADKTGVALALARTLAEFQEITWDCAGRYDLELQSVRPLDTDYRAWLVGRTRELLANSLAASDNTKTSDAIWVESVLRASETALAEPYAVTLVHEDYKLGNLHLEQASDGVWRVCGLFDLMTLHFGDGEADLARQLGWYLRKDPPRATVFANEYIRLKRPSAGFARRQQVYMLYDCLIIWEFFQRWVSGMPEQPSCLREWAGPLVGFWAE
ncbi:MAG: phosphotransferase [Meiothermus sp.]|nr:phosphotransferase [Meiothermus sp.]